MISYNLRPESDRTSIMMMAMPSQALFTLNLVEPILRCVTVNKQLQLHQSFLFQNMP